MALADLLYLYGRPVSTEELAELGGAVDGRQTSFLDLQRELRRRGIEARGFSAEFEDLVMLGRPAIAQLQVAGSPHFVVVDKVIGDWVRLVAAGEVVLETAAEFNDHFTGYVLTPWFLGDTAKNPRQSDILVEPEVAEMMSGSGEEIPVFPLAVHNRGAGRAMVTGFRTPEGWDAVGLQLPIVLDGNGETQIVVHPPSHEPMAGGASDGLLSFRVETDDPIRPVHYATLILLQVPRLRVYPDAIDFGEGSRDMLSTRTRTVRVGYRGDPGSLYVEPAARWLEAGLLAEQALQGPLGHAHWVDADIELSLRSEFLPGDGVIETAVLFETPFGDAREEDQIQLRVPTRVELWPTFRAVPPELFFGIVKEGEVVTIAAELLGTRGYHVEVVSSNSDASGVGAVVEASSNGQVLVRAQARSRLMSPGVNDGEVVLVARDAQAREMRLAIPYYVYVAREDEILPDGS